MFIDRLIAALGLLVASPLIAACCLAIALEDGLPVFYSQSRIGLHGRPFLLRKLRSMRSTPVKSAVTAAGDPRITGIGRFVRKYKLDELPQLWNVMRGDMNLIGPRPEVPRFVNLEDPTWQKVLSVRPGITDLATLLFRDEESVLATSPNPEEFYRAVVLPEKLQLNLLYLQQRSIRTDCILLFLTIRYSFWPQGFSPEGVRDSVLS